MRSGRVRAWVCLFVLVVCPGPAVAGQAGGGGNTPSAHQEPDPSPIFDLGEIVVVGQGEDGLPGVGGSVVTGDQVRTFNRTSLDQAVNLVPGVVSTFDANGRRNESDIFVRGFGRWQVPLLVDGVRVYLPADNRIDFARFLTADIAAIQVQKGYASVLDGPGGMGGAINLVSRKPVRPFESEAGVSLGGRSGRESWNSHLLAGARQPRYYLQGSINVVDRAFWTLSGRYEPVPGTLQGSGRRLSSDSRDWRVNLKAGYTPNDSDEYTLNHTRQSGEKGAPLNVYTNPPVPPNSYWRWPWWDVQNTSFLSSTRIGAASAVKTRVYYNTFRNGLDAFDDGTYTTQSAPGRFHSPYDDHAYGASVEVGTRPVDASTVKAAVHYRTDVHTEQQQSRPTHPTLSTIEPLQTQSQYTWSVALEQTFHATPAVDVVAGVSYDRYGITRAEEFNTTAGIFEYPKGGADAANWQAAVIWRHGAAAQVHASVSDRARFPVIFELYSTRFGTATPNPDLGSERATNVEAGWRGRVAGGLDLAGALFYSDVRDVVQTVVLPDRTTQTQNVGDGRFYGAEVSLDVPFASTMTAGGHYTVIRRTITDALRPDLRPTGVPAHRAFLYLAWQPTTKLRLTPSLDVAGDRWSDVNPAPAFPYVRTGGHALLDVHGEYQVHEALDVGAGVRNLFDAHYELAWGYPQPGRHVYLRALVRF
jgi:iron complex outermembrane recepter protein